MPVSDVTISFDNAVDSAQVEEELEAIFGEPTTLEVSGDVAFEQGCSLELQVEREHAKPLHELRARDWHEVDQQWREPASNRLTKCA